MERALCSLSALSLLAVILFGCGCARLEDSVDGHAFIRCAQVPPPAASTTKVGTLTFTVRERTLEIRGASKLRIAAFSGPVGAQFDDEDLALLREAHAELALYLGGLGDDEQSARTNLQRIAALNVPTLFIAGGADRWPVIEAAFAALDERARKFVMHASGLRDLRVGTDRFVIVAGAPRGRYALDAHACGFGAADLKDFEAAAKDSRAARTWLLSWHAPLGHGVTDGPPGHELGSPDLASLMTAVDAQGSVFAYPEAPVVAAGGEQENGTPAANDKRSLWVPRLGRVGSLRSDGSRVPRAVASLALSVQGLVRAP